MGFSAAAIAMPTCPTPAPSSRIREARIASLHCRPFSLSKYRRRTSPEDHTELPMASRGSWMCVHVDKKLVRRTLVGSFFTNVGKGGGRGMLAAPVVFFATRPLGIAVCLTPRLPLVLICPTLGLEGRALPFVSTVSLPPLPVGFEQSEDALK